MDFASARASVSKAVFATLGDIAKWNAVSVPVRKVETDEAVGFADAHAILETISLRVRICDVPAPARGDIVKMKGETFRIISEPRRDSVKPEWICGAEKVE